MDRLPTRGNKLRLASWTSSSKLAMPALVRGLAQHISGQPSGRVGAALERNARAAALFGQRQPERTGARRMEVNLLAIELDQIARHGTEDVAGTACDS